MTFTELVGVVTDYCNLTSSEATTRIGKAVNRHYRRVTSQLGLDAARFITRSVSMSIGVRTVTFTEIEKIDRILDTTDSNAIRLLQEVSVHDVRSSQPSTGQPTQWAFQNSDADSVVVLTDTLPQVAYSLQADGWTTLAALSGTDEPVFPESFHDILAWAVIAEELLKKEKTQLAREYERRADGLLSELQMFLADSHTKVTRQGGGTASTIGGAGGGGGNVGGSAYTQTALITFDLDPAAPFAVTSGSAVVTNLDADKLDGLNSTAFGLVANPLSQFAATTSAQLAGVISDETGSGALVFATAPALSSPVLTTPALGTPSAGVLTNCTGLTEAGQTLADNTTLDVSTTKHGYVPKAPNDATKFLDGTGAYSTPTGGLDYVQSQVFG